MTNRGRVGAILDYKNWGPGALPAIVNWRGLWGHTLYLPRPLIGTAISKQGNDYATASINEVIKSFWKSDK